jgi:ABC-type branched-subunit amino acid transport system ATPase component
MTALLELRGVTKRFRGLTAVDGVSLEAREGEIVGIVGPNGSGKTTIFACVTGFHWPEAGDIRFEGRAVAGLRPYEIARLGIARTFQTVQTFEDMSVLDNVAMGALGGGGVGLAEAGRRAGDIVDFVGLGSERDKPAGALGIPGRKRLEVAKAIATRPKLLLLDEVMAGLRPAEVDQAVELVKAIRARGVTIIVVEHLMRAVVALAERLYVLHHGALLAEGDDPREVLERPEVVEAYFGKAAAGA